jgi:hypothetical protein
LRRSPGSRRGDDAGPPPNERPPHCDQYAEAGSERNHQRDSSDHALAAAVVEPGAKKRGLGVHLTFDAHLIDGDTINPDCVSAPE